MRLDIAIDIPEDLPDDQRRSAMKAAKEAAVLTLFRDGAISTRAAAQALGLSYHQLLDRLASAALPVARGAVDLKALEAIRQRLSPGEHPTA